MKNYVSIVEEVLELESRALLMAKERVGRPDMAAHIDRYVELMQYLRSIGGTLFLCGVGKSGLIARKLASTYASLGLPAFYLHPVEALHGDLGRVRPGDAIIFLSKSGTTEEILRLMPFLPIIKERRIGLLGNLSSPLAEECGILIDCAIEKEACLNNQAPTTSTTLSMAMGDALAVVYESMIELSKENFAVNHPGGLLGKSLTIRVESLMWKREQCPVVSLKDTLKEALLAMTKYPVGGCAVIDENQGFLGILVEGDIRRIFTGNYDGVNTAIKNILNKKPISIGPETLAYDALKLMEKRDRPLNILPVVATNNEFLGFVRLHDLLKEGLILDDASFSK